jgi:hypothetical protein
MIVEDNDMPLPILKLIKKIFVLLQTVVIIILLIIIVKSNGGNGKELFDETSNYYYITSKDKNLEIQFVYDDKGLLIFGLTDNLSAKTMAYNFDKNRNLRSYMYKDNNYVIISNLLDDEDPYLIDRLECYKNIEKNYYLYKDGVTEIKNHKR